jgi:hypothetical protein
VLVRFVPHVLKMHPGSRGPSPYAPSGQRTSVSGRSTRCGTIQSAIVS